MLFKKNMHLYWFFFSVILWKILKSAFYSIKHQRSLQLNFKSSERLSSQIGCLLGWVREESGQIKEKPEWAPKGCLSPGE